jgi:hypothetical protein
MNVVRSCAVNSACDCAAAGVAVGVATAAGTGFLRVGAFSAGPCPHASGQNIQNATITAIIFRAKGCRSMSNLSPHKIIQRIPKNETIHLVVADVTG